MRCRSVANGLGRVSRKRRSISQAVGPIQAHVDHFPHLCFLPRVFTETFSFFVSSERLLFKPFAPQQPQTRGHERRRARRSQGCNDIADPAATTTAAKGDGVLRIEVDLPAEKKNRTKKERSAPFHVFPPCRHFNLAFARFVL